MIQTVRAESLNLHDIEAKFGLQLTVDPQSFTEWSEELPEISASEKQALDRVKASYLNLAKYPMLENTVKMVVLSPLLDLAGFYLPPFRVTSEESIQVTAEDEGVLIQGRIDVLVLQEQLWVLAIESKSTTFSISLALPQLLAYLLSTPHPTKPAFGLITNGSDFIFIKLTQQPTLQYALSRIFSLLNPGNDLYGVLSTLKRLAQLAVQQS